MPPAAIIGAAVIGAAGHIIGSKMSGDAQQNAAEMQLQSAREERAAAEKRRTDAMNFAAPSADELATLKKTLDTSDQMLSRQEQLISALDPTIVSAATNAKNLLQGQDAPSLNPIRTERSRQRGLLESNLREQLGSGYATSSSGMEALNRFDMQTSEVMAGAQQSYLGTVSGVLNSTSGTRNNAVAIEGEAGRLSLGVASGYGNIKQRQVNAAENFQGASVTPYAGASAVGAFNQGQMVQGLGQGIGQLAGFAANGGFGGNSNTPEAPAWGGAETDTNAEGFIGPMQEAG